MNNIRSPIVSVLGHVDHGKSSVLDAIRDTNILASEAGAITQAIGASIVPLETIQKKCGTLLKNMGITLTIPGLLFIDTPGHAAFTSLRKRGGNLADIAIVVVDINEGFKPQTIEAIEILRAAKTPFIIAANKLDLIPRFQSQDTSKQVLGLIGTQNPAVQQVIDTKIYELVGQIHEKFGMQAERFDRVSDFTQQISIIPLSAKKSLGLAELLMVISALAQKFLEKNLLLDETGRAKGTVLEVKEEQGLGTTMDVIIYNGQLKVNDIVVIGTQDGPLVTRVKAMFEPEAHNEMRDKKSSFRSVKEVIAATGVKLSCPEHKGVMSGMPLMSATSPDEINTAKEFITQEINNTNIILDNEGIIIKADNIGSLEALSVLLGEKNFKIRKASVGPISKKDITDAESNYETNPLTAAILGFNIPQVNGGKFVKVITSPVIYHLIEQYEEWSITKEKEIAAKSLEGLMRPCKIQVLANCIFRQSNPCVAGVEIKEGILKTNMPLIKNSGEKISFVKEMQLDKKNVKEAEKGKQVAVSIPNITGGRQLNEEDVLYSDIPPPDFRKLKKHSKLLTPEEIELLKEIAEIKRKQDPFWGK
ncbi:translation initiation factor IF-2 [Candidatus Woesearchaeota archaeon]|nr:translation initiation factor IF-2 [Candidatus Woesearchaeota archaeon]